MIKTGSEQAKILLEKSTVLSKQNQKIIKSRGGFIDRIQEYESELGESKDFIGKDAVDMVEGRDISVCVRARPLFQEEIDAGGFSLITAHNPNIILHNAKLDVALRPVCEPSLYNVDYAFGPDDLNETVYGATSLPLVRLALNGGIGTLFAYGQTGSGKTFTMTGILEGVAYDIFGLQDPSLHLDRDGISVMRIYASFFELLGSEASDLLNDNSEVGIMEDKLGCVQIKDLIEVEVFSGEQLLEVSHHALQYRNTVATFKNDVSSRSHAVCQIRIQNTALPAAENGRLYLIDLAGSERSKDTQFHDQARLKETKEINKSLMALKECIRNRTKASLHLDKHIHIPYRQSRLTLLLKDAFELESRRQCKTVVFACISPSLFDFSHTQNTLRYAAPIKIAVQSKKCMEIDERNPATWDNQRIKNWLGEKGGPIIDPETICTYETGVQMCRLPEVEFMRRCLLNPKMTEKRAKMLYVKLWKEVIDARTRSKKKKLAILDKRSREEKNEEWAKELAEGYANEDQGKTPKQLEDENKKMLEFFRNLK